MVCSSYSLHSTVYYNRPTLGTVREVNECIDQLEETFDKLKRKAIGLLQGSTTEVKDVVYELTTLRASEIAQHKVFLEEKSDRLRESKDHTVLFGGLNLYWTYLYPHLLKHLVKKLPPLKEMEGDMKRYMDDLCGFRAQTPLELFSQIEPQYIEPPEGFTKIVAIFKTRKNTSSKLTLQDIEYFRQEYGNWYQLRDFAFMLHNEVKENSFIVTFFVSEYSTCV